MAKHRCPKPWFPIWTDKWLFGSTRIELTPDERSVWIDLLALGNKNDGYIRANENVPYFPRQIAGLLNIEEELYSRTVHKCISSGKLEILNNGTMRLINWDKYSLSERHKRRIEDESEEMTDYSDGVSKKCAPIVREKERDTLRDIVKEKEKYTAVDLSPYLNLNNELFKKVWNEWIEYRKTEKKKPLTRKQAIKQLEWLNKQSDPVECINNSIRNGWQGLFPERTKNETDRRSNKGRYQFDTSKYPSIRQKG